MNNFYYLLYLSSSRSKFIKNNSTLTTKIWVNKNWRRNILTPEWSFHWKTWIICLQRSETRNLLSLATATKQGKSIPSLNEFTYVPSKEDTWSLLLSGSHTIRLLNLSMLCPTGWFSCPSPDSSLPIWCWSSPPLLNTFTQLADT